MKSFHPLLFFRIFVRLSGPDRAGSAHRLHSRKLMAGSPLSAPYPLPVFFTLMEEREIIENAAQGDYKYGFTSDIATETIGRGLD
ncbi:MAG: hypothetical protein K2K83_01495, partial [Rikenella sp.]|nr:hypothetical protein [Rikenella sp.]